MPSIVLSLAITKIGVEIRVLPYLVSISLPNLLREVELQRIQWSYKVTFASYHYRENQGTFTSNPSLSTTHYKYYFNQGATKIKALKRVANLKNNMSKLLTWITSRLPKNLISKSHAKELDPEEYSSREALTGRNSSNTPLSNSLYL
jgi:hypothetical protein